MKNRIIVATLLLIIASVFVMSCSRVSKVAEETLAFVESEQLDIRGKEMPSGETYTLEECFRRNRTIERRVQTMVYVAHEIIEKEGLGETVYILNTTGSTRDDFTIGYDYPDRKVRQHLSKTLKARFVLERARNLPPQEREEYLDHWRQNGWDGYL